MDRPTNTHIFDYIVVGKGLMGAASARYLSQMTANVAVIGPDEPEDIESHTGVFASHYDQGRITRRINQDTIWSALAARAVAQYGSLSRQSGVHFHEPVGCLFVALPTDRFFSRALVEAERFNIDYVLYGSAAERKQAHPELNFPADFASFYEPAPAGAINPRDLIKAQLMVAAAQGTRIISETVTAVEPFSRGAVITTISGQVYWARNVLVAAGAYTNCHQLLPQKLPLRVKTETTLLARLPESEGQRLARMPAVIYQVDHPDLDSIYMLPPLQYPNGEHYVKLGGNTTADQWPEDLEAMNRWMTTGDSDVMLPPMQAALQAILPGLAAESYETRRCLVTYTPHGKPFIDQVAKHVYVAAGGNGSAAKSSDTLGWLAASLMQTGQFPAGFRREDFQISA